MGWDKEDENHVGATVFALIPDADSPRQGTLLRDRGYAEIVPVAGRYHMDDQDALVLITEYETMSSEERFWFATPNIRMRTSTVKRFGGFSTATFCTETRLIADSDDASSSDVNQSHTNTSLQKNESLQKTELSGAMPHFSSLGW
jgi:hypothetical protein